MHFPSICPLPLERCVFHLTFLYSPVHFYVPLWLLELMSCLGDLLSWCVWIHSTSYFLVIHKSFQNTIVRVLMVFRGKPKPAEHCLLVFRTPASRQLLWRLQELCSVSPRPVISSCPTVTAPRRVSLPFCLLCSHPCEERASHRCSFLLCSACLLVSGWLCPCLPVSAQCPFLLELPQIKNFTVQGSLGTEFRGSGHLAFHTAIVQHPQCSGVPGLFLVGLCKTFK